MWFSYVITPLGSSMRVRKKFIIDIGDSIELPSLECRSVTVDLGEGISDDLMELLYVDPDVADLIRLGVRRYTLAIIP